MQHKKRVDPYRLHRPLKGEYLLLGDQKKFAPSVKYLPKNVIMPRQKVVKTYGLIMHAFLLLTILYFSSLVCDLVIVLSCLFTWLGH